ncbi:upstream activation factor subunit UAF30-like [Curcuma longa]|uniref:upstream activation factor subunit UAF30-like n=1 Tax=Curcuma longa TaxID=136217 RepID=UPI003D9EC52C
MVVGQLARKATLGECPKKVAQLIDLVNLPSNLREFADGQSQMSHLSFFIHVWSHIKTHNLQDPNNKNLVNCGDKLKSILLGKTQVELSELPMLIKHHFPRRSK